VALGPGTRLGAYEILSLLGSGGMGEVYRARDLRLNRDVAIKVLLADVATDADRLARFSREAQVLASLNHPNIAHIHGLEEWSNAPALVMEIVEGATLSDRIEQGPIPVADTLLMARQIADALEAAHEQGIIHRDLKPANIKVRDDGAVKILDFGLAKALDPVSTPNLSATRSPTLSIHATQAGIILGTAAYMSPEQARGKPVDKRTDIWAFGCVVYEMLTGRRAFPGDDVTDTIVAVVSKEPAWEALPRGASRLRPLIERCLKKDPRARLRDIGEARLQIDDVLAAADGDAAPTTQPPSRSARSTRQRFVALAAGVAIAAAAAVGTWAVVRSRPTVRSQPVQFEIVPPASQPLSLSGPDRDIAISRDGRLIVYRAGASSVQLMVRAIDQLEPQPIAAGTGALRSPFISPDGRWVGFFAAGALHKVSVSGGSPISLCVVRGGALRGASWGANDTIVFASTDPTTGLMRVSAGGGEATVLTKPDLAREGDHVAPSFLPDGRAVLFTILSHDSAAANQIALLDLDSGEQKTLIRGGSQAEYVAPASGRIGYLVYGVAGTLRAVRFDPTRREVLGDPVPALERVLTAAASGSANYSVAGNGTLVYVPGTSTGVANAQTRPLVWVDRQGREEPVGAPSRAYVAARLSPDGTRIALDIRGEESDIWIWDIARRTPMRLTFDAGVDQYPLWTPDSRRIIFSSSRSGTPNLYWQLADGTGTPERLTTSPNLQTPSAITRDGMQVVFMEPSPKTLLDLMVLSLGPPREAKPLVTTPFSEGNAAISPDGRWIAYQSNESGLDQVFVRPFPDVDKGRWQVSNMTGSRPVWAMNGRELYYLEGNNAMVAVPIQTAGSSFSFGNPVRLFEGRYFAGPAGRLYDVGRDGRFLMIKEFVVTDQNARQAGMVVVLNWAEELERRLSPR
jgi:serine/threonine-protein kinase